MKPIRWDGNVAIFTSRQVEDYGLPDDWNYDTYEIIENRETMNFATDYKLEQSYYKRPIHRYNRLERFETTLRQLIGEKGKVPDHILVIIKHFCGNQDTSKEQLWDQIRKILKHFKLRIYYNRIPFIVQQLFKKNPFQWDKSVNQYDAIVQDFKYLCFRFDQIKHTLARKYFPNMRFIALKLLEKHGVELQYQIPLARTSRKRKEMEHIWNILNS